MIETHNPDAVDAMHEGRSRDSFFTPYPGPDTGLLSHSTLDRGARLWQLAHVWFEEGRSRIASETSRLTTPDEVEGTSRRPRAWSPRRRWGNWAGGAAHRAPIRRSCPSSGADDRSTLAA